MKDVGFLAVLWLVYAVALLVATIRRRTESALRPGADVFVQLLLLVLLSYYASLAARNGLTSRAAVVLVAAGAFALAAAIRVSRHFRRKNASDSTEVRQ